MRVLTRTLILALAAAAAWAQTPPRLTLKDAEQLALRQHPEISAAQLTAQAAAQVPIQYHANYLPFLSGNLTGAGAPVGSNRVAAGLLNNPSVYNRMAGGVSVNQLVLDFGRTGNLVQSAKLHAAAEQRTTDTTRAGVVLQVDRAYYGVLRTKAVLTVAQETVKTRQVVADQVRTLAESKLKSMLDVSFANVNLAQAKLLQASAENDVLAAQADFSTALGFSTEHIFELADEPMPPAMPTDIDALIQEALADRPELASLRLEQSSALRFAKAERALMFPTIGSVMTAGYIPEGQPILGSNWGALGINVNIPILNGRLYSARHKEALYQAEAVEQNLKSFENNISRDVRVAFLNSQTAFERLDLTRQLLDQARLALDLAQSRYTLGLGSIVELTQAQLNLTSAEIDNVSAGYDYQQQRAVLDFEIGAMH